MEHPKRVREYNESEQNEILINTTNRGPYHFNKYVRLKMKEKKVHRRKRGFISWIAVKKRRASLLKTFTK